MLLQNQTGRYETTATDAAKAARAKMEAIIEKGRVSAGHVVQYVHENVPMDVIAKGRALRWGYASREALTLGSPGLKGLVNAEGLPIQIAAILDQAQPVTAPRPAADEGIPSLVLEVADKTQRVHQHALTQIAGKAGVPSKYLGELVTSENPKLRELAIEILRTHYGDTGSAAARFLLRGVKGEVRGFLSDRYRRLDNRPLLEAFAGACQEMGAVPVSGTVSDVRVQMKAYLPIVFEPVPGEVMLLGLTWGNSDFGAAAYTLSLAVLRLVCLNGATMEDTLRNVHLGRRLDESITYSDRTYRLDTAATVSATRDTVKELLGPERVNKLQAGIRNANEQGVEWRRWSTRLGSLLTKVEAELAERMFEGTDDAMVLPPGKTIWRASNVLSWIAGQVKDPDRRMDLERAAGAALDSVVAKAA